LKVLVTGAGGLVGRAVGEHCRRLGDELFLYQHADLDITDPVAVRNSILENKPDVVINCAAWTNVDACESDPDRAFLANATGPQNLAAACKEASCRFITISTDYVFGGEKTGFYTQEDEPNPLSVYAASKLKGEQLAASANERTIIVRTGYIFGRGGANFLCTAVDRVKRGEKIKAIRDMYGTPTYAKDLAARLRELAEIGAPGIYHVVNSGAGANFEDFTRRAVALVGNPQASVESVPAAALNRPAKRPRNSRLRCLISETIGLAPLRNWEAALEDFVKSEAGT